MLDKDVRHTLDERVLIYFAEKTSRSAFLSRLGKGALKILGISLLPFLPVNRLQAQDECTVAGYCGLWGTLCTVLGQCPTCASSGIDAGYWTCCCTLGANSNIVRYIDCCSSDTSCHCDSPPGGSGPCTTCHNNPNGSQPVWCPTGTSYVCTFISWQSETCAPGTC